MLKPFNLGFGRCLLYTDFRGGGVQGSRVMGLGLRISGWQV